MGAAMAGGSIEATLEAWASSLRDVKGRIRPLFQQERMAASAGLFVDALLGPERRKTGWMRAETAGAVVHGSGTWAQQPRSRSGSSDADITRPRDREAVRIGHLEHVVIGRFGRCRHAHRQSPSNRRAAVRV